MDERERSRGSARRARTPGLASATLAVLIVAASARAEAQTTAPQPAPQPAPAQPQVIYVQETPPSQVYVQPAPGYAPAPVAPQPARRSRGGNIGLIVSGAVMLGVGWVANFIVGLPAGDDPFDSGAEPEWEAFRLASLVPLAGPWIQLAVKPTGFTEDYWAMWLIIDGLLQVAGTGMLIAGVASSGDDGGALTWRDGDVTISFAPSAGPQHAGLALSGRF